MDKLARRNLEEWLKEPYDLETRQEIEEKLHSQPEEIENGFSGKLEFGTGGIRGIMGVGTNRINKYTISYAAQGLASYLKKLYPHYPIQVIIGYDNRKNSLFFAETTARILAGNKIKALLFPSLRPTPLVSFGCRYKKCQAAVMITASHNPPEYNGFKVYGSDGGQVLPPHDIGIIKEVSSIRSPSDVLMGDLSSPYIEILHDEIEKAYLQQVSTLLRNKETNQAFGHIIPILYTNLHGTGITLLPQALEQSGFSQISFVEKQKTVDENFTFAPIPNPEDKKALALGIAELLAEKKDILLATDPDADRLAAVVRHKNMPYILSGNQIACLLLHHICESYLNKLPPTGAVIKTIVTTEMFQDMANFYKRPCFNVLTGFKYIAEKMEEWDTSKAQEFLFGAEESYGYLAASFVRDKDAISSACLLAEAALIAKMKNQTLVDTLYYLYAKYGIFLQHSLSLSLAEGEKGQKQLNTLMENIRKNPPLCFGNHNVESFEDYKKQSGKDILTGEEYALRLPSSNVLLFRLKNKGKVVIRPSGTEPKIKIYLETCQKQFVSVDEGLKKGEAMLEDLTKEVEKSLQSLT